MCFGVALPPAAAAFRGPPPGLPHPRAPSGSTAFLSLRAPSSCLGASACLGSPCIRNPGRCRPHPRTVARAPRSSLWSPCHPEILSFTSSFRPASSCLPPAAPRRRVPCQVNAGGVRGLGGGQSEITSRGAVMGQGGVQPGWMRWLDKPRPLTPAAPGHPGGGPRASVRALGPQTPDLATAWRAHTSAKPHSSAGGICGSQSPVGREEGVRGERHLPWGGGRAAAACGLTASTQEAAALVWGPGHPELGSSPGGQGVSS